MDYQKLYTLLFNAITDAITQLDNLNVGEAKMILQQAQCDAEQLYIEEEF